MLSRIFQPKGVLFDWQGTLVGDEDLVRKGVSKALAHCGLPPLEPEFYYEKHHVSPINFLKNLVQDHAKAVLAEKVFKDFLSQHHLDYFSPFPGVEKLLRFLKSKNIYMAIASNKKGHILRKEVSYLGWEKYFKKIIGLGDTPYHKPSPVPIQRALDGFCLPQEAWFVGDSFVDVQGAHNAELVPVFMSTDRSFPDLDGIHVKNPLHLLQILENFFQEDL